MTTAKQDRSAAQDPSEEVRRHLSSGRAALGEMFGGHFEERSHGAVITTHDGVEFLNCAGYGVLILGATHPHVVEAVVEQVRNHPVSSRILLDSTSGPAARALAETTPGNLDKVHFVSSGAEAAETALKMARANGKRRLITTTNGYHGKTMGALSVTGRDFFQEPFRPLLPEVEQVPYGDAEALETVLRSGPESCFIVEPVQGEGGVIHPPESYLDDVARICAEHDCFLIIDEILTGLGRLGRWWGSSVQPDAMLVGKGLSGGVVPVAAVACTAEAYRPFDKDPFLHTSTFAAAPIAAAAAKAAVEAIVEEDAVTRAANLGARLKDGIAAAAQRHCAHLVREVRGEGLLLGVEFEDPGLAGEMMLELTERHVLANHSLNNSTVLRFTPPAVLTEEQLGRLLDAVEESFRTLGLRAPAQN